MKFEELISQYRAIDKYFEREFPQLKDEYKILARLGKITEELGELNSAVHGELQLHREEKQAQYKREDIEKEWADLFNTVMLFGLVMDLDMPKIIKDRLEEIFQRFKLNSSVPAKQKTTFHVGVIISLFDNKGRILLAKRSPVKTHAAEVWENISGAIEAGEQPLDALKREMAEELGDDIKYEIGQIYNTFQTKLENGREIIGISYLCKFLSGDIKLNEEHTEYKWASLDEAIEMTETSGLKEEFAGLKRKYPDIFR